ncbi:MAG: hypothetical protein ABI557_11865 [Aureliella sp.]
MYAHTTPTVAFCSKDPIGYVNGASLYRAYFVLNRTDPSGLDWTVPFFDDWWDHYYEGNGQHFNLEDSPGIFNAWANSDITNGAIASAKGSIADPDPSGLDCGSTSISMFNSSFSVDYAPGNVKRS